eukprot:3270328-Amphidinium_carterae.1
MRQHRNEVVLQEVLGLLLQKKRLIPVLPILWGVWPARKDCIVTATRATMTWDYSSLLAMSCVLLLVQHLLHRPIQVYPCADTTSASLEISRICIKSSIPISFLFLRPPVFWTWAWVELGLREARQVRSEKVSGRETENDNQYH